MSEQPAPASVPAGPSLSPWWCFLLLAQVIVVGWAARDVTTPLDLRDGIAALLVPLGLTVLLAAAEAGRLPGAARFALGLLGTAFTCLLFFDATCLVLTSTHFDQALAMASLSGDTLAMLDEAGFSTGVLLVQAVVVVVALLVGGLATLRLPRLRLPTTGRSVLGLVGLGLLLTFAIEQVVSSSTTLHRRSAALPLYPSLRAAGSIIHELDVAPPLSIAARQEALSGLASAARPDDVVFLLLESFREDLVTPEITPNLARLMGESLRCTDAVAEATYTPLAWNTLLLDRPSYLLAHDLAKAEEDPLGAWPLEVLAASGYRVKVALSTHFAWFDFERRLLGTGDAISEHHLSFTGDERDTPEADRLATDSLVRWIEESGEATSPLFALLQLDGTHWPYYSDRNPATQLDSAGAMNPLALRKPGALADLRRRYLESARDVDAQVGRVLAAIEASKRADRTAVVVVSDHGEGFAPGKLGHLLLHRHTKRVPLAFRFPGREPGTIGGIATHRDVFPTLFDHLGIDGLPPGHLLGRSVLPPRPPGRAGLTFQATLGAAELTLPLCSVQLDVRFAGEKASFTPTGILDPNEVRVEDWEDRLESLPWRAEIERIVGRR
ncbi:MAG: sulfatase-like hydrolase/transferase [Acidobacteriota bacterium]